MQYVRIKDLLVEQIDTGMLSPSQKLPSERKLAESFDTTRVTLREALSLLEAEGRIYREDRRGWFISPLPLRYDPTQNPSFSDIAHIQNRVPATELVTAKSMMANKQATHLLNLPPFSDVYHIERVHYLEKRPVVYVTHYINPKYFPNILDYDLTNSLTKIYRDHFGIFYKKSHYRISTSTLLGEVAQALRATSGTPAMVIERTNHNQDGDVIDSQIEYWRHDAIKIESIADLN
ncbi:phosphonate utilization transcriptional regulator PhnR [Vibrio sp.]|uniref:phosphonate utilization transcriptional regulator PhnR n=1 Tax=Vibrio sp. TaxID=678 RepID=UPI00311FDA5A